MATNKPMSLTLKALTCLLLLAISMNCAASARILDQVEPPVSPVVVEPPPEETPDPDVAPVATTTASTPTVQPTAGATATATDADHHPLTFFMHDILGGSNPSARIVTGVVSNTAVSGQLPFAKPNGAVLPINGGVNLPTTNNGIVNSNNNNNNNLPFLTGLGGQTNTIVNNNGNNIIGGNGLPFLNAGQLPSGASLQKLLFGTLTVIDDVLTEGHDLGSGVVGKAQGFYVASSEDGTSQTMAFTAMFQADHYVNSLTFFGVHRTVTDESHLAVLGGTGKFVNAKGYAIVKTLNPEQHTTDGVETLLELTVFLSY
ncbi:dirigent protein 25-like [Aristolochia californica]|uniref:dirigent protein 25-like n=1 Tax=Aristolochia californica TaxID=171875 RepID=UPI0035DF79EC